MEKFQTRLLELVSDVAESSLLGSELQLRVNAAMGLDMSVTQGGTRLSSGLKLLLQAVTQYIIGMLKAWFCLSLKRNPLFLSLHRVNYHLLRLLISRTVKPLGVTITQVIRKQNNVDFSFMTKTFTIWSSELKQI